MSALAIVVAVLGAGAIVTLIGAWLIERAHPPCGGRIAIDGFRQHLVELGEGVEANKNAPPIVLLHGAGCNLEDMRLALGAHLAARHRLILVDRPGHGWSERKSGAGSSPADQAAVLRKLFDRLAIERAVVVGHSWGGALAATFALDYPDCVAGLVLLAAPTHPHLRAMVRLYAPLAAPYAGFLFAHTLALPFAAVALGPGVRAVFLPQAPPHRYLTRSAAFLLLRPRTFLANARDIAGLETFLARQVPRYATLAVPAVLITGDRDRVVPPHEHAMALAAAAPAAKLVVLPGFGHMLHHAAAARIVAEIEQLLANSE